MGFLEAHKSNPEDGLVSKVNRAYAQPCLNLLAQDDDGYWIIHYLGNAFQQAVTHAHHNHLYQKARDFVVQQLEEHKRVRNSKLAFRYAQLLAYFDAREPSV